MVQQHSDGDPIFRASGKLREILPDRSIQTETPGIHQPHRRTGGPHDFGNGCDVPEAGVRGRYQRGRVPGEVAVTSGVQHRIPPADDHHRSRVRPLPDALPNDGIHVGDRLRPPRGREAKRCQYYSPPQGRRCGIEFMRWFRECCPCPGGGRAGAGRAPGPCDDPARTVCRSG